MSTTTTAAHDDDRDAGTEPQLPGPIRYARTTPGGIGAAAAGRDTLGRGTIVLCRREGDDLTEGQEEMICRNPFRAPIPHPSNLIVVSDGEDFVVVAADLD